MRSPKFALLFASLLAIPAASAFTISFGTAAEYDNNFLELSAATDASWSSTSGGRIAKNVTNSATTMIYNTTSVTSNAAGSGGTSVGTANNNTFSNFTMQMDFSSEALNVGGNSIGFYTKVNSTATSGYLAIFRLTSATTADFRLWDSDSNPTANSLGTILTPTTSPTITGAFSAGTAYNFRLDVQDVGANVQFTASIFTAAGVKIGDSIVITDTTAAALGAGQVGLRLGSNSANANYYDNFTVNPIPEPSSLGLAALGGLLVLRRKRK